MPIAPGAFPARLRSEDAQTCGRTDVEMDVLVLIDELDDAVRNAKRFGLGGEVRVDKDAIYDVLERMRATIPGEVNQARWIVGERDELIVEAKLEAERVLKETRVRQARLIDESDVVRSAEREADKIVADARAREREIRVGAERYADDVLNGVEVNLQKLTAHVQRGRSRLAGRERAEAG